MDKNSQCHTALTHLLCHEVRPLHTLTGRQIARHTDVQPAQQHSTQKHMEPYKVRLLSINSNCSLCIATTLVLLIWSVTVKNGLSSLLSSAAVLHNMAAELHTGMQCQSLADSESARTPTTPKTRGLHVHTHRRKLVLVGISTGASAPTSSAGFYTLTYTAYTAKAG